MDPYDYPPFNPTDYVDDLVQPIDAIVVPIIETVPVTDTTFESMETTLSENVPTAENVPRCFVTNIPIGTIYKMYHDGNHTQCELVNEIPNSECMNILIDGMLDGMAGHLGLKSANSVKDLAKIMHETQMMDLCNIEVYITPGAAFVKIVSTPEIEALQGAVRKLVEITPAADMFDVDTLLDLTEEPVVVNAPIPTMKRKFNTM
jgi:hypothetical protein